MLLLSAVDQYIRQQVEADLAVTSLNVLGKVIVRSCRPFVVAGAQKQIVLIRACDVELTEGTSQDLPDSSSTWKEPLEGFALKVHFDKHSGSTVTVHVMSVPNSQ